MRCSCSASTTLTTGCANVRADNDHTVSARSRQAADKPSGPPISSATSRPPDNHCCICAAIFSVSIWLPDRSSAMTVQSFGNAVRMRSPSSRNTRLISLPLSRLPANDLLDLKTTVGRQTSCVFFAGSFYPHRHVSANRDNINTHRPWTRSFYSAD